MQEYRPNDRIRPYWWDAGAAERAGFENHAGRKPHGGSNPSPTALIMNKIIQEYSAGGIVFRKFEIRNSKFEIKWLISQHAHHKGWVFPKGLIGDTEENKHQTKEETAIREVKEETGIDAKIVNDTEIITKYYYYFEKQKYHKTVYFFLMEHLGGNFNDRDDEMMDVAWATEQQVKKTLTYQNDKTAFDKALKLFDKLP